MIVPYKNRVVDYTRPVCVYRNLNKVGRVYSVKQDGLVKGHTTAILLVAVTFVVQHSARAQAVLSGKRNVHAWVCGTIAESAMGTTAETCNDLPRFGYNIRLGFRSKHSLPYNKIKHARAVVLNQFGSFYAYGN